eukprot:XP_028343837.1 uncharacterized protein LOC102982088 [Physeter catodon]
MNILHMVGRARCEKGPVKPSEVHGYQGQEQASRPHPDAPAFRRCSHDSRYLIHLEFILAVRPALRGQLWPKYQRLPVLPDVTRRMGWTASTWYLGRSRKAWMSCGRLRPRAARTGSPSRRSSSPTVGSTCERAAVSPGDRQPRCPVGSKQGFVSWPFLGGGVGQLLCRPGLGRLWLFPKWGFVPFPGWGPHYLTGVSLSLVVSCGCQNTQQ